MGVDVPITDLFDTVRWRVPGKAGAIVEAALDRGVNLRLIDDDTVSASTDETTSEADVEQVWAATGDVIGAFAPAYGTVDGGRRRGDPRTRAAHLALPHAPGVHHAPQRDVDAPVHPTTR